MFYATMDVAAECTMDAISSHAWLTGKKLAPRGSDAVLRSIRKMEANFDCRDALKAYTHVITNGGAEGK